MAVNLEANMITKAQPRAMGLIAYSEGSLGKSTFLVNAVNDFKRGILIRIGHDGISPLNLECPMYKEVIGSGDTSEQAVQGWVDFQETLRYIFLAKEPYDIVCFDETDNAINHCLYQFILDKHYKKNTGEIDIGKANGYGGAWIKEAYSEATKIIKMLEIIQSRGTRVFLSFHAQKITMKDPQQTENYKTYSFNVPGRDDMNIRDLFFNWADVVLFGTLDVTLDSNTNRATGSNHVFKTKLNAAYLAKSRYNIPEKIALNYGIFKECIINSFKKEVK